MLTVIISQWWNLRWFFNFLFYFSISLWCLCLYVLCCAVLSHFSYVRLFATLWTVARQVPLSMGFSLKCFPFPVPGNLPNPGMEPVSLMAPASTGGFFTIRAIWEAHCVYSNQKVQLRTDDDGGHWKAGERQVLGAPGVAGEAGKTFSLFFFLFY